MGLAVSWGLPSTAASAALAPLGERRAPGVGLRTWFGVWGLRGGARAFVLVGFSLGFIGLSHAKSRGSASYSITTDTANAAGGRAMSVNYSDDGSMGEVVGLSTNASPLLAMKHGFIGQLYEVQSLAVTTSPAAVNEGQTTQLSTVATMDDGSLISLGGSDAQWSILSGLVVGISSAGLATAGEVFINAPAAVSR